MENNKNLETLTASSKNDMPGFKVQWNSDTLWNWDIGVGICAICRYPVMEACFECQIEKNHTGEECKIACGACKHEFHFHCITRWLKTRHVCPFDNTKWEYHKHGH